MTDHMTDQEVDAELARIDAAYAQIERELDEHAAALVEATQRMEGLMLDLDAALIRAAQPFYPADQSLPEGWPPAPHVHEHVVVADFGGIRASIAECRTCGDTRTFWRSAVIGEVIG